MTRAPSPLADLFAECDGHGIRLMLADDGGLTIDAPRDVLTCDLLRRLKAQKRELLKRLRQPSYFDVDDAPHPAPTVKTPATKTVCRCGSTVWRDVPIHNGRSIRRDCGRCRRFIEFLVWYGMDTLRNEQ
jgi:hypothetical protein